MQRLGEIGSPTAIRRLVEDGGFIQIFVLLSLAAICYLLVQIQDRSFQTGRQFGVLDSVVRGRLVARSAIAHVLSAFDNPANSEEEELLAAAEPTKMSVSGTDVWVRVEGEGGKINLDTTPVEIVAAYVQATRLEPTEKQFVTGLVDSARREGAPVDREKLSALLLEHVGADLLKRDFTAFSTLPSIDPRYASPRVLAAIPGLSLDAVIRLRKSSTADPAELQQLSPYFGINRSVFTIEAVVNQPGLEGFTMTAVVEVTASGAIRVLQAPM